MPHRNHHHEGASEKGKGPEHKGDSLMTKGRDMASSAAQAAGEALSNVGEKADDLASSVGSGMESLGGSVRRQGPSEGTMGRMTSGVAGALETSGRYLQREGFSGMLSDCGEFIGRHPLPTVFIVLGIGFLLGRALGGR